MSVWTGAAARRLLPATLTGILASTWFAPAHAGDEQARRDLDTRIARLEAIKSIETLQNAFGYYQDRFLFDQSTSLFAKAGAEVHDDGGVWLGQSGLARWRHHERDLFKTKTGPVAGTLFDQPQMQGVIDIAADGINAVGRFRTLGRSAVYGVSEDWRGGVYENDYVFEHGQWKIKILRYCTTWTAAYQTGRLQSLASPPIRHRAARPDRIDHDACPGDDLSRTIPLRMGTDEAVTR